MKYIQFVATVILKIVRSCIYYGKFITVYRHVEPCLNLTPYINNAPI